MIPRATAFAIGSILLGACSAPTAPPTSNAFARPTASQLPNQQNIGQSSGDAGCTFSRGTTTCASTVQYQETSTHSEYSGCNAGPNGVPGQRVRTFSDVDLVTVTTTTLLRGRSDHVYSSQTVTTKERLSSTQTSDVCQAL